MKAAQGWEPRLDVVTPERVALELPVAGLGSRALAYLIDLAALGGTGVVVYFAYSLIGPSVVDVWSGLSTLARVLGALAAFGATWLYWTMLEVWWNGQTLGKRAMSIRVVRADGGPVAPLDSAVRNLFRLIDFLPLCYPVGLISMLVDRRHRRIGDLAAGTVLVRAQGYDLTRYLRAAGTGRPGLAGETLALTLDYLARFENLVPRARLELGRKLAIAAGLPNASTLDVDAIRQGLQAHTSGESVSAASALVRRRKQEWDELADLLSRRRARRLRLDELERLDRLYRRVAADLARAQATLNGTEVHWHLNELAGEAYRAIYRPRSRPVSAAKQFFRSTFPSTVRHNLDFVGGAAAFLILGAVVGAGTVALHPNGAHLLLSDELRELIDRRELWTDHALSQHSPSELATLIFTHNLRASFTAFVAGVTAGLGTAALLLFNGAHLGALLTHCSQSGLGPGIFDFVAAHGPVELSALALCGGAGLMVGQAIVAPGERPRADALRERSREAVTVVVGCIPLFVGIGIVEGFVSPGPLIPTWVKAPLGLLLAAALWLYLLRGGLQPTQRAE